MAVPLYRFRRMATIVSLHAHPDDESITVAGLLARSADAGHRVVLVFGTRGELGTPVEGALAEGEQLAIRRTAECYESARVLGAERVEFLGYVDSGMMGDETNDHPWVFWQADLEQAANRLAAILREEEADVLTTYDDHGGYGHPDHIQVHRVGRRAAELAGVPLVIEATSNREMVLEFTRRAADDGTLDEMMQPTDEGPLEPPSLPDDFGTPVAQITHVLDAVPVIDRKRASMLAHGSQIGPDHFMAAMPDEVFALAFGTEWFVVSRTDGPAPDGETVLDGLLSPNPQHAPT